MQLTCLPILGEVNTNRGVVAEEVSTRKSHNNNNSVLNTTTIVTREVGTEWTTNHRVREPTNTGRERILVLLPGGTLQTCSLGGERKALLVKERKEMPEKHLTFRSSHSFFLLLMVLFFFTVLPLYYVGPRWPHKGKNGGVLRTQKRRRWSKNLCDLFYWMLYAFDVIDWMMSATPESFTRSFCV